MQDIEPQRLYSVNEAAKLLGVTRSAIAKRITRGVLVAQQVGHTWVISGRELAPLIPTSPAQGTPAQTPEKHLRALFGDLGPGEMIEARERLDEYLAFTRRLAERIVAESSDDTSPQA